MGCAAGRKMAQLAHFYAIFYYFIVLNRKITLTYENESLKVTNCQFLEF